MERKQKALYAIEFFKEEHNVSAHSQHGETKNVVQDSSGEKNYSSAHNCMGEEIVQKLNSNSETGLTSAQVADLQAKHGENRLREKKKKTTLQRFLDQFKDVMILILIAAAIVSFVVVVMEKNWYKRSFIKHL